MRTQLCLRYAAPLAVVEPCWKPPRPPRPSIVVWPDSSHLSVDTMPRMDAGANDWGSAMAGGQPLPDRVLATRLAARDPDALAELYRRFGPLVLGVARRVVRDGALAEDVAQEVFTSVWQQPDRYDPERGSLKSWVGMLAHRRSVDKVRAETRRARTEARSPEPGRAVSADEDRVDVGWICDRVRHALDRLPEEQREVLMCAYFEGRTYRQVAADLTIPEGTVKSRIRLALARLHEILRADVREEGALTWT